MVYIPPFKGMSASDFRKRVDATTGPTPAPAPKPAPAASNQTTYLNNLVAKGGGVATWAQNQLKNMPKPAPKPATGGMSAAQITAELQRKKNLGKTPSNAANQAQYNTLTAQTPAKGPTPAKEPAPVNTGGSSSGSSSGGYKTVYLESGGSVVVNGQGQIVQYGGKLSDQQIDQLGKTGTADDFNAQLEQEYRAGKIKNTFDFIDGKGTQWNTGTTDWSPFAVDLQTAARNAGQISGAQTKGTVQPGTVQPGTVQPGAVQQGSGAVQPDSTNVSNSAQSFIDQLNEARRNKVLADLGKSRDAALSNLSAEKSAIQPQYYDARNQVAAGSQQGARSFAEFMANRGGARAGSAAQAELNRLGTLQGNIGNLDRQEAQAYTDIARRTSDIGNAYESDVASANAGIEADRMSALLNDYYVAQERGDRLAQFAIQNELARAGYTGMLDGQPTLQAQGQQFNQQQKGWENRFNYGQAIGKFGNGQTTTAERALQRNLSLDDYNRALDATNLIGEVTPEFSAFTGIAAGTSTNDARVKDAQLKIQQMNANASSSSANLSRSRYDYEQSLAPMQSQIVNGALSFNTLKEATDWLNGNATEIIRNLGADGFTEIKDMLPKLFETDQSAAQSGDNKELAISLSRGDIRWNKPGVNKQDIIKEYIDLLSGL